MTCTTPVIRIPDNFIDVHTRRRKRSDDVSMTYVVEGESLTFYVGLVLDGVDTYRFVNESSPGWASIGVSIESPSVAEFPMDIEFEPHKDTFIRIPVQYP